MTIDIQQHNQHKVRQATSSVEWHFKLINEQVKEGTIESLTDAVECADDAERILQELIHKLQANRAEMRYAIDELKRNTVKVG
jgi:hypothetical protein